MTIKNTLVALIALAGFTACSNIADDERLVFIEHKEFKGIDAGAVLIEDFTGQKCTWCPEGTRILEEKKASYGEDKVITVAIHSGGLGFKGNAANVGLMTELGEYYWNQQGFTSNTSQPTAVFNRRAVTAERDNWGNEILKEMDRHMKVAMKTKVAYDETTRTASISVTHLGNEDINAKLQLWLIENGIVAMQIDGGQTKRDYVHNHVLREAINGNDGQQVNITTTEALYTTTYTIPEKYVAENCEVVAFFYDADGVLQVVKTAVK